MTPRRLSFSQRMGYALSETPPQLKGMSQDLRISLWNVVTPELQGFRQPDGNTTILGKKFANRLYDEFFKWPIDSVSGFWPKFYERVREAYLKLEWQRVYELVEFFASAPELSRLANPVMWNVVLERENSAYRLVSGLLVPVTNDHELSSLTTAAQNLHPFPNAHEHLSKAAQLLGDRLNPDYANSIKESISAIESLCQTLTGKPKATLGDALKYLEDQGIIHGALKATFSALYGYTSDAAGIRHGKGFGEDRPDQADARFILITCSAFINYVIAKQAK